MNAFHNRIGLFLILFLPTSAVSQARLAVYERFSREDKALLSDEQAGNSHNSSIHGPVLGFVFDSMKGGLRPIWGIAGASTLGEVMRLGRKLSLARVSPWHDYALAVDSNSGELVILYLNSKLDRVPVRVLTGTRGAAKQIVLSSTGASAVFLHENSRTLHLVTGLPQAPLLAKELDISSLPPSLTSIAVSDDGEVVLLGTLEGDRGAVFSTNKRGQFRVVSYLEKASAITFIGNSRDALIADSQADQIFLVHDVTGAATAIPLAGEAEGISSPVAIGVSDDNQRAFIANSKTGTVTVLDLTNGESFALSCNCMPSRIDRLKGDSIFVLTEVSEKPLQLLEGKATEPRILFVPPVQGGSQPSIPLILRDRGQPRRLRVRGIGE